MQYKFLSHLLNTLHKAKVKYIGKYMKYILYLFITLISANISLGYDLDETSQFIDDLKVLVLIQSDPEIDYDFEWEDLVRASKASSYIHAVGHYQKYMIARILASKKSYADTEDLLNDMDKMMLDVFGYSIPGDTKLKTKASVLVKYALDNPGKLTDLIPAFIDYAFADTWGIY